LRRFRGARTHSSSAQTPNIPNKVRECPAYPSHPPRPDHEYPYVALTEWCYTWRKNGWRTSSGKPVVNKELIDYIITLLEARQRFGQPVQLEYVKGHSGDVGNDGADALAVAGCSHPEIPEKDWVRLKESYDAGENSFDDFVDIDPAVGLSSLSLNVSNRTERRISF
jgi:hypothetical protein